MYRALNEAGEEKVRISSENHAYVTLCACVCTRVISAETWPQVFDDSEARRDWGWQHKYDLRKLVESMVRNVNERTFYRNAD
jgi:nucleoside-diphosphate-sugar epimerase